MKCQVDLCDNVVTQIGAQLVCKSCYRLAHKERKRMVYACHDAKLELNACTRVQQVPLDTDPLMWWKQHVQEFPCLDRMVRQYLTVPATSVSPERLFSSVGLVKSDLRGRLLDTTLIDVMRAKQAP